MPRLLTIDDDSYAIHPIYAKFKGWRSSLYPATPSAGRPGTKSPSEGRQGIPPHCVGLIGEQGPAPNFGRPTNCGPGKEASEERGPCRQARRREMILSSSTTTHPTQRQPQRRSSPPDYRLLLIQDINIVLSRRSLARHDFIDHFLSSLLFVRTAWWRCARGPGSETVLAFLLPFHLATTENTGIHPANEQDQVYYDIDV
jgi:hypothetical protein